jgi:hypothetical protein
MLTKGVDVVQAHHSFVAVFAFKALLNLAFVSHRPRLCVSEPDVILKVLRQSPGRG